MLGVVENPVRTPADEVMEKVAGRHGRRRHLPPDPGRRVLRRPGAEPGEQVADPYFGGAGPDRNACLNCGECMTGCRHNAKNTLVKNYLYLAEQAGAVVHPLTTVTRVRPRDERRLRGQRPLDQGEAVAPTAVKDVHRRAGRLRGGRARHPAAAAPAEGRGRPARALRPARPADPHQLRVDPRRDRAGHLDRLQPRRRDHLVVPPRRGHPHRAGALRQGQQRDVAAADRAHRRRRARARAGRPGSRSCGARRATSRSSTTCGTGPSGPSSPWSCRRLDNSITTQGEEAVRPLPPDLRAGPRPAQPDLDPGRQRGRTPDGRRHGRHRRRLDRRAVQPADDRALHRRLHDRRLRRRPGWSTPTSGSTATRACTSPTARRSRPTSASTRR